MAFPDYTPKPRIERSIGDTLQRSLRAVAQYLPSLSDRCTALSIADDYRGLTEAQAHLARRLIDKANKFAASGRKGSDSVPADIFDDDDSAPAVSAPSASVSVEKKIIQIEEDELHRSLARIVSPALEGIAQQVNKAADERQAAFNRTAARDIAQQVLVKALEELEKRKPREIHVHITRADDSVHVSTKQHPQFANLCRTASVRVNGYVPGIMLAGEAGSGKTTGAKHLAQAFGLDWHFNGAISFPHEMLGFIDAGGTYHTTPFRQAYEHGGVYTFDEVDRSDPVALLAVNPHLANGLATFPDKQVKRHENCIIIATANTWGRGGDANYSGATKLDAAFLSRFPIKLAWDIDPALEEAIVNNAAWLDRVRSARARAQQVGLKVMIDTRHGQAGAQLIAQGFTLDEAASMTYLADLKPEQRKQLEDAGR